MLCVNRCLHAVDLSFNELPPTLAADVADDCVLPLCRALALSTTLLSLRYAHAGLSVTAGVQLGHALAFNSALTELDLSYNQVGDAGCSTIASALAVNSTLRRLSLAANGIGAIGASALCQRLHAHAAAAVAVGTAVRSTRAGPASPAADAAATAAAAAAAPGGGGGGGAGPPPLSVLSELCLEFNDLDDGALVALRDAWAASPWRLPGYLEL